jgi:hypothetical protein
MISTELDLSLGIKAVLAPALAVTASAPQSNPASTAALAARPRVVESIAFLIGFTSSSEGKHM